MTKILFIPHPVQRRQYDGQQIWALALDDLGGT
jgi:hypothetical protein